MTRASCLLVALSSLVLPSCKSVSLGGSSNESDAGGSSTSTSESSRMGGSGGNGGIGAYDAAVPDGRKGGASGTSPCQGLKVPDIDCTPPYGPTYICSKGEDGWFWDYTCGPQFAGEALPPSTGGNEGIYPYPIDAPVIGGQGGSTDRTCTYKGKTYPYGVSWMDVCNTCYCDVMLQRSTCTAMACLYADAARDADTCPRDRIDTTQAATALARPERPNDLGPAPGTKFGAEEMTVPNLWETMQAQLFWGTSHAADGSPGEETAFVYSRCTVTRLGTIEAGVVASNGAFYYSSAEDRGKGIRSTVGMVYYDSPDRTTPIRTGSPVYPQDLVVALEDGQAVVYRVTGHGGFNQWQNPVRVGRIENFGTFLAVVGDDGVMLPDVLE